jgi:hypothetical protein
MTVTTLNNYSFAFNGFVFGGAGSPYQITSVDGLEMLPTLRVQDSDRGYLDGMFSGRDFLSGRYLTIQMLILGDGTNSAQTNYNLLQSALLPQQTGTTPLQFQLSPAGTLQRVNARVRGSRTVIDPEYTYGYIKAQYEFFAPDANYYDDTLQSAIMTSTVALGRTYNRVYDLTFGGGSQTGTVNITNSGWATTYPTITVNGPVTNLVLGNLTTNDYLYFSTTMGAADVLVVDLYARTVTLNGNPARNLLKGGSAWFDAPAGTSSFYFTGQAVVSGTTMATVTWRNAYI